MELCRDLFGKPHKLSRSRMFGHYVHAITAHSATQYELASLRSLNTEGQERLFGQARSIAESCTNHHADNVIPQIMLRLQAKQEQHMAMLSVQKGDTQVSHIAKELPPLPGTSVKLSFLNHRLDSWQLHLKRISPFLTAGEDVWWTNTSTGFHFYDGDGDSATPSDDHFTLLHYRHHSIADVEERRQRCWYKIIQDRIMLPASEVKVYDVDGKNTGRLQYCNHTVTFVPLQQNSSSSTPGAEVDTDTSEPFPPWSGEHSESPLVSEQPETNMLGPVSETQTHIQLDLPQEQDTSSSKEDNFHSRDASSMSTPHIHLSLEEGFTTSLANYIKVLLPNEILTEFDKLRFSLKEIIRKKTVPTNKNHMVLKYNSLAANIGTKVLSKRVELDKQLEDFEHKYFQQHGKLPGKNTNSTYHNLLKEKKIAIAVLRNIDITSLVYFCYMLYPTE